MNYIKKINLNLLVLFSALVIVVLVGVYSVQAASSTKRIIGYAWSGNVGWVSFSDGTVVVDDSGNLSGYAWSSNIGWVKFGGLSGFPDSSIGTNAKLDASGVSGWARVVSVSNPIMYKSIDNRGGWDGWISLSSGGKSPAYGVTTDGTKLKGFAWGSDVVGWLNWDNVRVVEDAVLCASANGLIVEGESTLISSKISEGDNKGKCQTQEYTCKDRKLTAVGSPSEPVSCTKSADCEEVDGLALKNGESYRFFKKRVVAGGSCQSLMVTCNDGVLEGEGGADADVYKFTQCLSAPNYKESQ